MKPTKENTTQGGNSPPKWLDKLLEWFCAPHVVEEVLGDLHERYYLRAGRIGMKKARRLYFREVLSYMRLSIYKRKTNLHSTLNSLDMLTNYLLIAYRNLVKHKAFSLINILGLSMGMAVAILNGLWIYDELSFDTYHQNYKHIAQVMERGNDRGRLWLVQVYSIRWQLNCKPLTATILSTF